MRPWTSRITRGARARPRARDDGGARRASSPSSRGAGGGGLDMAVGDQYRPHGGEATWARAPASPTTRWETRSTWRHASRVSRREYGARVIVGEATRAAAGAAFEYRFLDVVAVMGRQAPFTVYELLGRVGDALARRARPALALSRRASRSTAGAGGGRRPRLFDALAAEAPDDGPVALYRRRSARAPRGSSAAGLGRCLRRAEQIGLGSSGPRAWPARRARHVMVVRDAGVADRSRPSQPSTTRAGPRLRPFELAGSAERCRRRAAHPSREAPTPVLPVHGLALKRSQSRSPQ